MSKDFRYTMPDGSEIEAFQVTEKTRYLEADWPEWMDSRYFMTIDSEEWLNVNDVETRIPEYGWVVNRGGQITAVDFTVMEKADKVVKEEKPYHPPAEVDEEKFLAAAAKITGKSVEELRMEEVTMPPPEPISNVTEITGQFRNKDYDELLDEVWEALKISNATDEALHRKLRTILAKRTEWCNCPPGMCEGGEIRGCRANSPLAS